jgi:lysophospholipase L1-like esterase
MGWPGHLVEAMQTATSQEWFELPVRYAVGGNTVERTKDNIDGILGSRSDTPTYTLILLGANDPWVTENLTEASFKADYRTVLDAIRAKWTTRPIYLGKSWREGSQATMDMVNGWIDDLIAEHPSYLFNAYDSYNVLDGHAELSDGVHPNHAGCIAMADEWTSVLTA